MNKYYSTIMLIFRVFHFITRQDCRAYGERNPAPGAKIIAGNHPNATDGFFLPFLFKEQLHFFMQGDLFDIFFVGWMLANAEQIPVIPEKKIESLYQAAKLLKEDKVVAIFPEAALNPDGQSQKIYTGAIRLALMSKAPIIPLGFYVPPQNLKHVSRMKNGRVSQGHWQNKGHCYLHIGSSWMAGDEISEPVESSDLYGLSGRLMEKINDQARMAAEQYTKETGLSAELASFTTR